MLRVLSLPLSQEPDALGESEKLKVGFLPSGTGDAASKMAPSDPGPRPHPLYSSPCVNPHQRVWAGPSESVTSSEQNTLEPCSFQDSRGGFSASWGFWRLQTFLGLWLHDSGLCFHLPMTFSLLRLFSPASYKDIYRQI